MDFLVCISAPTQGRDAGREDSSTRRCAEFESKGRERAAGGREQDAESDEIGEACSW